MVGVAGKSKACHNCKARRVKCDLERPHCLRCAKAKLKCLGYGQKQIFVNRTPANPSITAQDVLTGLKRPLRSDQQTVNVVLEYGSLLQMLESETYSTIDFRNVAYRILRRLYFPEMRFVEDSIGIGALSWVTSVCKCKQESLTLDYSLLAFCASQLYITRNGNITLNNVLQIYNEGLSRLSGVLQHMSSTDLTSVFASIVVLSTCELFIDATNSGWVAHVQGIADILRLRLDFPRQMCSSEDWARLCARIRVVSVISNLVSRRRGKLTALQWQEILIDRAEDPLDNLLGIISNLPEIFELQDTPEESIIALTDILDKMYDWENTLRMVNGQDLHIYVSSQMHNPVDDPYPTKLYPNVLEFRSLSVSSCLIVCWSARLQTLTLCVRLCNSASLAVRDLRPFEAFWKVLETSKSQHMTTKDALEAEASHCARLLCQCVEYTHRVEMGTYGPQSMTYAKWALQRYFEQKDMSRELEWCQNIPIMTSDHGTHRGIRLMDFQR